MLWIATVLLRDSIKVLLAARRIQIIPVLGVRVLSGRRAQRVIVKDLCHSTALQIVEG